MPDLPTSHPKQFYQGAPLLLVPDVPATADFYRRILGFTSDPGAVTTEYSVVWRDNAAVHLARGEHAPTGVRIFFWVRDVNALHEEVVERWPPSRCRSRRDPTGLATFPFSTRTVCSSCLGIGTEESPMASFGIGKLPFGDGVWGVVAASVLAIVLILAYLLGPRSVVRGAFAVASLAVFVRQVQVFRSRRRTL